MSHADTGNNSHIISQVILLLILILKAILSHFVLKMFALTYQK